MARTGRPKVEWIKVNCAACGKEIERRASDLQRNRTGRVFCSKACQDLVGAKPRRKQEVACQVCGKVFYPRSGNKGIYCSRACHNVGQTRREDRTCPICGRTFQARPSVLVDRIVKRGDGQYTAHARRFCSKECEARGKWQRPQQRIHNGKPVLLTPDGYVKVWEPSRPPRRRWVLEHRLVMERILGRSLRPEEHVHHLNRDRSDNSPENLQLVGSSEHSAITSALTQERINGERAELERYRQLYGPLPPE